MKKEKFSCKKLAGDILAALGEKAVGKCLIPGMFDPKIPEELKSSLETTKIICK